MNYIPPHKRHSKDSNRPSPIAELLAPQFKRDLNLRSSRHNVDRVRKIIYADQCIYRWFAVDLDDTCQFPSFLHLEPISEPIQRTIQEKSLVLVNNQADKGGVMPCLVMMKWEGIYQDDLGSLLLKMHGQILLTSFNNLRNKIECKELEKVKPTLVARFGKILFVGKELICFIGLNVI
ncbi:hypothetical protein Pint_03705 [Pistacia integerrima]|uniref:Uncharacterized protein n=1 Tax=Pistacia integerrima TaxID=434235 RepID=A0ACC0Z8F6_9ROSI|nr:hypothetical protein Pint_03705 [Pistacia integerrima]